MQQSIQRMSGQVQAMQQEIRELSQLAQHLYHQHTGHYQQLQGQMMQNSQIYQLAGNEQASANLLKILTDVCTEMNQHLRTISQQVTGNSANMGDSSSTWGQRQAMSAGQGMNQPGQTRSMNQSGMGGTSSQPIAPEGPLNTDTTHVNRATVPGMDRRITAQVGDTSNNQLQGVGSSADAGFRATSETSSTASMVSGTNGTQMTSGWKHQSPTATVSTSGQTVSQKSAQSASMMSAQGTQSTQGAQSQMTTGTQSQATTTPYHGYQQPSGNQGNQAQMTSGTQGQASMTANQGFQQQANLSQMTSGAQSQTSMTANQGYQHQANPSQMTTGSTAGLMSASSTSGTMGSLSAQNKNSSNEYREEPNATNYPYNRSTT